MLKLENEDPYAGLPYDAETKEQMRMITLKNFYNTSISNEMKNFNRNYCSKKNLSFPKELPLLLFVTEDEIVENWLTLHEEQVKHSVHGKVMTLEGEHYLHHTRSKEIVENLRTFMEEEQ